MVSVSVVQAFWLVFDIYDDDDDEGKEAAASTLNGIESSSETMKVDVSALLLVVVVYGWKARP